jgi:hypothetical protein
MAAVKVERANRRLRKTLALLACCIVSASLLLLGLLITWSTIKLVTGLTPYPSGTEMHWQTPALGVLWAAGCFASSAAISYLAVTLWWPNLTPRERAANSPKSQAETNS